MQPPKIQNDDDDDDDDDDVDEDGDDDDCNRKFIFKIRIIL